MWVAINILSFLFSSRRWCDLNIVLLGICFRDTLFDDGLGTQTVFRWSGERYWLESLLWPPLRVRV